MSSNRSKYNKKLGDKESKRAKSAADKVAEEFKCKKTSVLEDFFNLKFKYLKVENEEKSKHQH